MAHFAKIGIDNTVLSVIRVSNKDCMTDDGEFIESLGVDLLVESTGHETWVRCSYNTRGGINTNGEPPLRKNFPCNGWIYDSSLDAFIEPAREGFSWDINPETGLREPPTPYPNEEGKRHKWDNESLTWVEMPQSEWYV